MENIFFPDLNGSIDFEDLFLADPWIDNTELSVQNIELPEPVTAQEVLEETILSPAANDSSLDANELDQFFPEEFINLAEVESNMNSYNTLPTIDILATDSAVMSNVFDDLLVKAKEEVACQTACPVENIMDALKAVGPIVENSLVPEDVPDSAAVVPNVVPEVNPSSPSDNTPFGAFTSNFSLDLNQLDPAIAVLLENLEKSVASEPSDEPKNSKRALADNEDTTNPLTKKKKMESTGLTEEDKVPDKTVERRIKNNAASRVCRAVRKARHEELFQQEKDLGKENKELTSKVEELSATVEYLRNYLVDRLSGRCN